MHVWELCVIHSPPPLSLSSFLFAYQFSCHASLTNLTHSKMMKHSAALLLHKR